MSTKLDNPIIKPVFARLTPSMTREQIKRNLIAALEKSGFTVHPAEPSRRLCRSLYCGHRCPSSSTRERVCTTLSIRPVADSVSTARRTACIDSSCRYAGFHEKNRVLWTCHLILCWSNYSGSSPSGPGTIMRKSWPPSHLASYVFARN